MLVDDIVMGLGDGLVLIGSPEAEAVTSLAFGYERRSDGRGMRYLGSTIDLPYRWEENEEVVHARCSRMVPGRGRVERPNWPIVDQAGIRSKMLYPTIRNDGMIYTDLLLITKVPNFLTVESYQCNRSIISVAGTHGTGTRAVGRLLKDDQALRRIATGLAGRTSSFQVLVEAGNISHTARRGSVAGSIVVRDVRTFDLPESGWRDATNHVQGRLHSWLEESVDP